MSPVGEALELVYEDPICVSRRVAEMSPVGESTGTVEDRPGEAHPVEVAEMMPT